MGRRKGLKRGFFAIEEEKEENIIGKEEEERIL